MLPPHLADMSAVRKRGAKIVLFHGTSDPIFSSDAQRRGLRRAGAADRARDAATFARLYLVPGMNHCRAGPATDQFDLLTPLVAWVERGQAPGPVNASARGAGNAAGVNADLPPTWSATRTRPLCPYPAVARYSGSGDIESAASFVCRWSCSAVSRGRHASSSALPRRQLLVAAAAALGAAPGVARAADAAAPSDSALAALRSEVPLTLPGPSWSTKPCSISRRHCSSAARRSASDASCRSREAASKARGCAAR